MNYINLQYFMEVYNLRNITKAADKLHISRQALSKTIRDLEKELGVVLFQRNKQGMHPTEAAHALSRQATIIVNAYSQIYNTRSLSQLAAKEIRVFAVDSVLSMFPDSFYKDFMEEFPDYILHIDESKEGTAMDLLRQGDLDFAIVTEAVNVSDFKRTYLMRIRYTVMVDEKHPLASRDYIDFKDLMDYQIIGKGRFEGYYLKDTNYINETGGMLNIIFETTDAALSRRLVKGTDYIVMSWDYDSLGSGLPEDGLVMLPITQLPWGCDLYLVENNTDSKKKTIFRDYIVDWIQDALMAKKDTSEQRLLTACRQTAFEHE